MSPTVIGEILRETGQAWIDNKAARLGAALAFYSVLSLSPLVILFLAVASAVWGADAAQGQIAQQIDSLLGEQGGEIIRTMLTAASSNKFGGAVAAAVGVVSLLFSASAVFGELQDAMNLIWHVAPTQGKARSTFLRERLFSVTMVLVCGFLLLASVIISAGLAAASHFVSGHLPLAIVLMGAINFLVSIAIITFIFALIFKTVPDHSVSWEAVFPGALLTSVLFVLGKGLIGLYLGHAGIGSGYGAAGSIVVLLVWIYYSAQILFFGAEFAYVYARRYGPSPDGRK